jgi:hypothetical protein
MKRPEFMLRQKLKYKIRKARDNLETLPLKLSNKQEKASTQLRAPSSTQKKAQNPTKKVQFKIMISTIKIVLFHFI